MTDAELHERASRIFLEACELPDAQRSAFLDRECAGDDALRVEVEALLAHDEREDIFETPVDAEGDGRVVDADSIAPQRIGNYRLLDLIGEGGMGVVYRAEQENPRRIVALKLIRPGIASPRLLHRFRIEAEALGRLHHPGIAQIYEAGTFEMEDKGQKSEGRRPKSEVRGQRSANDGDALTSDLRPLTSMPQPYFAMEYVEGRPLLDYASDRGLDVRRRLALFMRICDACQHAHEHGVVHRDLKPANIFVDETGQPKILDFGVARLTDSDAQVTTIATGIGQLIGTIPYMSPEQVGGDPQRIGARADVYALGVIAYELLTGRLPHELVGRNVPDAVRIISEQDPTPLSSIDRMFRGDLDTILMKALDREPERRYASAAALAEDVRRYLADEPIVARPPSTVYQLHKFARRNKTVVGAVAAVFLSLCAGIVATSWKAIDATRALERAERAEDVASARLAETERAHAEQVRQREIAQREAARLLVVNGFLHEMLASARPERGRRDVTVREVLESASERLEEYLTEDPETRAMLHNTIGTTYHALGLYEEARPHFDAALAIRREVFGPEHALTLTTINDLALTLKAAGDLTGAESLYRQALEASRRLLGEDNPETLTTEYNLAALLRLRGEFDEAESLMRHALRAGRAARGDEDHETLAVMNSLALLLLDTKRLDEGESLLRDLLAINERVLGPHHPGTIATTGNLASILLETDRAEDALALVQVSLPRAEGALGEKHPLTLMSLNYFCSALVHLDRAEEALTSYRELVRRAVEGLPPDHWATGFYTGALGQCLTQLGRHEEAETNLLAAHRILSGVFGPHHPRAQNAAAALAALYAAMDRPEEVEKWTVRLDPDQKGGE